MKLTQTVEDFYKAQDDLIYNAVRAERLRIADELYREAKNISCGNHIRDWPTIENHRGRKRSLIEAANRYAVLAVYGGDL